MAGHSERPVAVDMSESHRSNAVAPTLLEILEHDPFRFAQDGAEIEQVVRRAQQLTDKPYSYLVITLLGAVDSSAYETAAKSLWFDVVAHRDELSGKVGRVLPLRAAAIDWLYLHDETQRPCVSSAGAAGSACCFVA